MELDRLVNGTEAIEAALLNSLSLSFSSTGTLQATMNISYQNFGCGLFLNNNDVEYQAETFLYQSPNVLEVYYQEKARAIIAFEIKPDSHNFVMCYWTGVAMDMA